MEEIIVFYAWWGKVFNTVLFVSYGNYDDDYEGKLYYKCGAPFLGQLWKRDVFLSAGQTSLYRIYIKF